MSKTTITIKAKVGGMTTGMTTFKGGVQRSRRDRVRNRNDKYARRALRNQLKGD